MDHSTNPLSSDLYKIRFKHSAKQWPTGRFRNYREKLEKLDGSIVDIICTRTYPIVQKRKKPEKNIADTTSSIVLMDPITQEQKKKLADKQTNLYANLFGYAKIPQVIFLNYDHNLMNSFVFDRNSSHQLLTQRNPIVLLPMPSIVKIEQINNVNQKLSFLSIRIAFIECIYVLRSIFRFILP